MKIPSFFRRRKNEEEDDFDDDFDFDEADEALDGRAVGSDPAEALGGTTVIDDDNVDEDDSGGDREENAAPEAAETDLPQADGDDRDVGDDFDDDLDDADWDDDELEGGEGIPRGKLIAIAGGGTAGLVLVVVLGAWLFLGGDPEPETTGLEAKSSDIPRVSVELPPKAPTPATPLVPLPGQTTASPSATAPSGAAPSTTETGSLNAFAATSRALGAGIVVPPMTPASFVGVPLSGGNQPLSPAPDPALVEEGVQGPLPIKAEDGRVAWQVYSRPPPALPEGQTEDRRARVAIIIKGLGLSQAATEAAIRRLPGSVTLAFDSEALQLGEWAALARRTGHETLVQVPMESSRFPEFDPGPNALSTLSTPDDNVNKVEFHLSRMTGYIGILTQMGSAFTINEVQMTPVMEVIRNRGLMFVDSYATLNTLGPKMARNLSIPYGIVDVVIDETLSRTAIDRKLAELVAKAKRQDAAIGVADPLPITMERIGTWANAIPREQADVVLVPVSAVANLQPVP